MQDGTGEGEGDRHYGFTWWGGVMWRGGELFMYVFILGLISLTYWLLGRGPWPLWFVLLPMWTLWLAMLAVGINIPTPVSLGRDGFCIRVLFGSKFIQWHDVEMLVYKPFPAHIVYVRYISPFHYFVAVPGRQSFPLVLGLDRREELFWEINRRASRAQNRDIPIVGWTRRKLQR